MHKQLAAAAIGLMLLDLARIVGHVEQQTEIYIRKEVAEDPARVVPDDLSVGERAVDGSAHSTKIALADFRLDRAAGQLAIRQGNSRLCRGCHHLSQELGADLVPEPSRAAMDGHHDLLLVKTEIFRRFKIEDFSDACTSR
jgi:hypothetical protein